MFKTQSRSMRFLFTLSLILISQAFLSVAFAAPACDAEFMTTLRNRAWREAQREITMNQANIYKPDSVFALSCFDRALTDLTMTFSEADPRPAVRTSVTSYISSNFPHGTLTQGTGGTQPSVTTCGAMNTVWTTARCRNLTLAQFIAMGVDPRAAGCTAAADWDPTNTRLTEVGVGAAFDSVNLFLRNTDPLSLLEGENCQAGIPTGVQIGSGGGTSFAEKVCPNPGCAPRVDGENLVCCDQNAPDSRCE